MTAVVLGVAVSECTSASPSCSARRSPHRAGWRPRSPASPRASAPRCRGRARPACPPARGREEVDPDGGLRRRLAGVDRLAQASSRVARRPQACSLPRMVAKILAESSANATIAVFTPSHGPKRASFARCLIMQMGSQRTTRHRAARPASSDPPHSCRGVEAPDRRPLVRRQCASTGATAPAMPRHCGVTRPVRTGRRGAAAAGLPRRFQPAAALDSERRPQPLQCRWRRSAHRFPGPVVVWLCATGAVFSNFITSSNAAALCAARASWPRDGRK